MTRWGELKCPECAALEAKLAEAEGALSICSASWGECNRILDETKAKLAKAVDALHSIDVYGSDTLSGCSDGLSDAKWYRYGVIEMRNRARATLAAITGDTP
jgi:hypothetical protein